MLRQSFTSLAPRVLPRVLEAARPAILLAVRNLATKAPGSDPLDLLKKECIGRNLCDEEGYRLPGKHWVISVAVAPEDRTKVSAAIDLVHANFTHLLSKSHSLLATKPAKCWYPTYFIRRNRLCHEARYFNIGGNCD
jgi:hypothetical protein